VLEARRPGPVFGAREKPGAEAAATATAPAAPK
jgi:hypothetical protein